MRPCSQGFYLLGGESYQREFLHSKLLDKTLDVSDESFHVVSIDPVWLPRLVVSSEGQNLEDENLELGGDNLTHGHLISTATTRCVFWKCRIWCLQANLLQQL